MLSACDSGLPSRFDDISGVDVCQLNSPAEAEHILGPIKDSKTTVTSGSGFAGDCTWTLEHSELWLLQSDTLLTLRMKGGSAAQLETFARALSREMALPPEPKGG